MKNLALGVALCAVVGFGIHSSVYACDHTSKVETAEAVASVPAITVEVAVPLSQLKVHRVSLVCARETVCDSTKPTPSDTVKRTARTAATLGRALVTTVEAVVGSLVEAAVGATADLV